jgi:uncharacterized protein YutD
MKNESQLGNVCNKLFFVPAIIYFLFSKIILFCEYNVVYFVRKNVQEKKKKRNKMTLKCTMIDDA